MSSSQTGAPRARRHPGVALTLAYLLLAAACGSDGTTPPGARRTPAALELTASLAPTAYVGTVIEGPRIRVHDSTGAPVAGARVAFATTRGTTTLAATSGTTDARGTVAVPRWQLPTTPTADTLVVTVAGVLELRVPLLVRAGPVSAIELLAPATGEGRVLQSMLSGPAFRVRDRFGNPVPFAELQLRADSTATTTPRASRLQPVAAADSQGIVTLAEWVPRTLGDYAMRATTGFPSVVSPRVTRSVRTPDCVPAAMLPTGFTAFTSPLVGALGADATQPCGDLLDRLAVGFDVAHLVIASPNSQPFGALGARLVRAGSIAPEAWVTPRATERVGALLPLGEWEVVLDADRPVTYWLTNVLAPPEGIGYGCSAGLPLSDVTFLIPGSEGPFRTGCRANHPVLGLSDAPTLPLGWYAAGVAGRALDVTVTAVSATLFTGEQVATWTPVLLVYGVAADGSRTLLETVQGTGREARARLAVPTQYAEVHLFATTAIRAQAITADVLAR